MYYLLQGVAAGFAGAIIIYLLLLLGGRND